MTSSVLTPVIGLASQSHKANFDLKGLQADCTGTSTILLVSVGADYHEGEKLGATVDLINRSGFARVTVAVADTLQRHNLDLPPGESYELSRRRGDQWIARNRPLLDLISGEVDVLRWDDALSHPDYPAALRRVQAAYVRNRDYRAALDSTVDRFLARQETDGPLPDTDTVRQRCLTYLFEECPVIQPLWADQGYDFVIYPQQISTAMQATRDLFVVDGSVAWLPLRFKKRKSAR